jgi:hypothetical protein
MKQDFGRQRHRVRIYHPVCIWYTGIGSRKAAPSTTTAYNDGVRSFDEIVIR